MLLVTAEPCALEILRGAYARSVLKPPATYTISSVGEFESFPIPELYARINYIVARLCAEKSFILKVPLRRYAKSKSVITHFCIIYGSV